MSPERDYILVTVELNCNGRKRTLTQKVDALVGQHVQVEAPSFAARVGARAALLWHLGLDDDSPDVTP